jgi:cellulose synthase (UDP-forming)
MKRNHNMHTFSTIKTRIEAAHLTNTTILFLLAAPFIIILYISFLFNPNNIDNFMMWIIQVVADSISVLVLLSLWLTILMDVLVARHHRVKATFDQDFLIENHPTIDVLITVAGEPLDIVEKTLVAATAMDYPHQVFILDDGQAAEIAELAKKYNAGYVTRNNRLWAKSGNLNNGLKSSSSDFFAIFDADQVPKPDFITKMLPYMKDEKLAMVQSPQHYGNTDKFIASGTAQAQEVFYKHVCPSKNISNSAFCVGTNVIFRRTAINEIGGIAQVGHSEDIWTSLLLHEANWKTLFVNEILAIGQAPEKISSFFKQQLRWSRGGLSMLLLHNPLFSNKLSIDQKVQYFTANFFYLVGFSILAYLSFPIIYLLFGIKALHTESGFMWLLHYLPYFGLYYSLTWLLLGRIQISTIATALASFFPYLLAFTQIIFGTKFNWVATTAKKAGADFTMKWIWPHVFLIILSVLSIMVGWFHPRNFWTTFYNTIWATVNMYLLYIFVTGQKRIVKISQTKETL